MKTGRFSMHPRFSPFYLLIIGLVILTTDCSPGGGGGGAFILGQAGSTVTSGSTSTGSGVTLPSPTPTATPVTLNYKNTVLNDGPAYYWRLDQTTGTTFTDMVAGNTGTMDGTFSLGISSALADDTDPAAGFSGGGFVYTADMVTGPNMFTVEFWFKTSTGGGRIFGFSNAQTGTSTDYDRHIYLDSAGHVYFGVDPSGGQASIVAISSPNTYADGNWHYVAGTCCGGTNGMILYIDGQTVATGSASSAQSYSGYWRMGSDNLFEWPGVSSYTYYGDLDEVAVYNKVLTSTQISNHYNASK